MRVGRPTRPGEAWRSAPSYLRDHVPWESRQSCKGPGCCIAVQRDREREQWVASLWNSSTGIHCEWHACLHNIIILPKGSTCIVYICFPDDAISFYLMLLGGIWCYLMIFEATWYFLIICDARWSVLLRLCFIGMRIRKKKVSTLIKIFTLAKCKKRIGITFGAWS